MGDPALKYISYEEYLALELETDIKHEWLDGQVYAMSGGTPAHSQLAAQMIIELGRLLGDRPCRVYGSDLKIRVPRAKSAIYPDAAVVCGDLAVHPKDANAVTNPSVLVEVLSDSTERWDRAGKFRLYRKLDSLRDCVLVSQHERIIEVYSRSNDGAWTLREATEGASVQLSALGEAINVDRIYRNVSLTPDSRA